LHWEHDYNFHSKNEDGDDQLLDPLPDRRLKLICNLFQ